MRCDRFRELISALLDGEATGPGDELARHLEGCPPCRSWEARARALHRSLRLRPAPDVPDLTPAILARGAADPPRRARPRRRPPLLVVLRAVLAVLAGTQLVVAAPELLARTAEHGHATRHLGGWDVAFAVGLLVVALQPWRARGLLPMAGAVAGVMVVTGTVDFVSGGTPGMAEVTHLLEVCGMAVLWAIARQDVGQPGDDDWRRRTWTRLRRTAAAWSAPASVARSATAPVMPASAAQMSALTSCAEESSAESSRITASRARATRDRTVPTGQSQTSAVSA